MWNKLKTWSMGVSAFVLGLFSFLGAKATHAAADSDLGTALASTTAIFTDNKSQIMLFFVGIFLVIIVIGVAIAAMNRGKKMIVGTVGGGGKRRR